MAKRNFKYDRLGEQIKCAVSEILENDIENINFVSITSVELTKDLGDAKIYFQCLSDGEEKNTLLKLEKSNKYIRKLLTEKVKLRRVPNLIFKYDSSLDNYNKIDELLKK